MRIYLTERIVIGRRLDKKCNLVVQVVVKFDPSIGLEPVVSQ